LARLGTDVETPSLNDELAIVQTVLSAARTRDLQRQLSGLTHGEGVLESSFEGHEPVIREPPTRRRTTPSPLDLEEYMAHLAGQPAASGAGASDALPSERLR
jgi:ribosomal protection tetracycline resistance protein